MNCPECGGEIQATHDEWLRFDPEQGVVRTGYEVRVYCENDHELDANEAISDWVANQIAAWDRKA